MGGLFFTVCFILQTCFGFGEIVALQVPENHLDLRHTHTNRDKQSLNEKNSNKYNVEQIIKYLSARKKHIKFAPIF